MAQKLLPKEVTIVISDNEVMLVFEALSTLPFSKVYQVIAKIQQQVDSQAETPEQ
jgi:hypothetical protein